MAGLEACRGQCASDLDVESRPAHKQGWSSRAMAEEHLENEVGGEPPRSDVDVTYAVVQRLERENSALRDQLGAARDQIESSRRALALLGEPALQPALALDYRACF